MNVVGHFMSTLKTKIEKDEVTRKMWKLLDGTNASRFKILCKTELLIDTIQKMSEKSLKVLESKSNSYRKLLTMLKNGETDAEIQEIKTKTEEIIE